MDFDQIIERRQTHSLKWDMLQSLYGLSPDDGIPMWVADMEFKPPVSVQRAVLEMAEHGVFGYYGDDRSYHVAIRNWLRRRHDWEIETDWIFTAHGLVNGTALCIDAFTEPGDGIVIFTPVYHAFSRVIRGLSREIVECELVNRDGRYVMDFETYDARMTGRESMAILCSPHNPGGRVWTGEELGELVRFCERHDLFLVSDEIHQDLVFDGNRHIPTAVAAPRSSDRLMTLTAATKTFNIAGCHTGNVIISDGDLHQRFATRMMGLGISPGSFGPNMVEAAYNDGEPWLEDLLTYLDGNRKLFDEKVNAIPGVASMPLEATYLAWVDFSGTDLGYKELVERIQKRAAVAPSHGHTFGSGGEQFMRFNFACQRHVLEEALDRLRLAFSDLAG